MCTKLGCAECVSSSPQLWYLSEVYDLCALCRDPWLCARVLGRLSHSELSELMNSTNFSMV